MSPTITGRTRRFAPPDTDATAIRWLQLIRSRRVGPTTFLRLMDEFGDAERALDALPDIARQAGVRTYTPFPADAARQEFAAGRASGARLIFIGAADYPALLATLSDPPPVLWARGATLPTTDTIAIVGARNASSLGTRMARLLAGDLGRAGQVVVSGLARGIDTAAHLASLETGTIAVMAGGVDVVYPKENQKLAEDIAETGLILSEQPIGMSPQARHFPRRNRIISGLCRAVIVVEGAAKSGSLITAREALDQGREVMAVPGHPLDARASGCNMLIRDGATLVRGSQDIMNALTVPLAKTEPIAEPQPEVVTPNITDALDLSRKILSMLSPSPIAEDQLIRDLDLPSQTVSGELVTLELQGKLARHAGGMLALVV